MRHRRAGWKLGRNTEHRRALLRNLVTSLIVDERIETTLTKAKAMRPHVEKMITLGKRGDVAARRQAAAYLMTRDAVDKLFNTISPRYGDREGGPVLDPKDPAYKWTDRGVVASSDGVEDLNAIDPGVIHAPDGTLWLCYGSYHGTIDLVQLDPKTGQRISPKAPVAIK